MDYVIHNVAHHPKTRHIRAAAPTAIRHKQFILKTQRRLIPNKPIELTDAEVLDNLEELLSLESRGIVELRTRSGEIVDLKTFQVQPKLPPPPLPKFRQDSAQNDPPRGKPVQFVPDTTEELTTKDGEHSGGGMTEQAMLESKDQDLPPLPEELMHLEEAEDPIKGSPVEQDEEPEVEYKPEAETKKKRRR